MNERSVSVYLYAIIISKDEQEHCVLDWHALRWFSEHEQNQPDQPTYNGLGGLTLAGRWSGFLKRTSGGKDSHVNQKRSRCELLPEHSMYARSAYIDP